MFIDFSIRVVYYALDCLWFIVKTGIYTSIVMQIIKLANLRFHYNNEAVNKAVIISRLLNK